MLTDWWKGPRTCNRSNQQTFHLVDGSRASWATGSCSMLTNWEGIDVSAQLVSIAQRKNRFLLQFFCTFKHIEEYKRRAATNWARWNDSNGFITDEIDAMRTPCWSQEPERQVQNAGHAADQCPVLVALNTLGILNKLSAVFSCLSTFWIVLSGLHPNKTPRRPLENLPFCSKPHQTQH